MAVVLLRENVLERIRRAVCLPFPQRGGASADSSHGGAGVEFDNACNLSDLFKNFHRRRCRVAPEISFEGTMWKHLNGRV